MLEAPPPWQLVYTYPAVRWFLQALADTFVPGVSASSWYRNPSHNRSVGGAADSQHLLGLAVDLVGDRWALASAERMARAAGLTPVYEGSHLHVQLFPAGYLRSQGYGWLFGL